MSNKFYTPDGFNDTLPSVCAFKKDAESKLRRLFSLHGYEEIETPGYEYCDIYTKTDFVKEEDLYKLTDSKGRLLCARYDGTIPAARFAATLAKDRLPLRLSYIENMYRFNQTGGGKQSEFTQAGAEVKQMGLDEETALTVRNAIVATDSVTIERTAKDKGLSESDSKILLMFAEASGDPDILDEIRGSFTDSTAIEAIKNLEEILTALDDYGYGKYVNVDLGLLGSEGYYTGVIFKGYTYEVGFPIIGGGRYDRTVGVFGRDMECVGFSLGLSLAITALMRQGLELESPAAEAIVGYEKGNKDARNSAITLADQMRVGGTSVILDTSGMNEEELNRYADENDIQTVFWINGGQE